MSARILIVTALDRDDLPVPESPLQPAWWPTQPRWRAAERSNTLGALHLDRGALDGMNASYSAGTLKGLAHCIPETRPWMARSTR